MVRIEREKKIKLLSTFVSDKLTEEDYDKVLAALQQSVNEWYGVRWYFELRDFSGWESEAALEEMKFDIDHAEELAKVAIVGNKKWECWIKKAMKAFPVVEFRYFTPTEKEDAKQWISS